MICPLEPYHNIPPYISLTIVRITIPLALGRSAQHIKRHRSRILSATQETAHEASRRQAQLQRNKNLHDTIHTGDGHPCIFEPPLPIFIVVEDYLHSKRSIILLPFPRKTAVV